MKLATNTGWTVAHEQANKGWTTEDKETLKWADKDGRTVAYLQVGKNWITEDKEILMLANNLGWTVAHEQVSYGWTTEDKKILKLADIEGWTVAHEQAKHGWITTDEEILKLTDLLMISVCKQILSYWNDIAKNPQNNLKIQEKFDSLLTVFQIGKTLIKETDLEKEYFYLWKSLETLNQFYQKIKQKIDNFITKKVNKNFKSIGK